MRRFGPFLLVGWLASPVAADARPALSVDAPAALRCPAAEPALAALVRQLAPHVVVPSEQPLGRFHLRLRPHGTRGVSMTLRADETLLVDRTIDVAPHECDGLADTVALIAAARVRDAEPQPGPTLEPLPDAAIVQPWDDPEPAPTAPAPAPPASTGASARAATPSSEPSTPSRTPRKPAEKPATTRAPEVVASKPTPKPTRKSIASVKAMRAPKRSAPNPPAAVTDTSTDTDASPPAASEPAVRPRVSLEGALGTTVSLDGRAAPSLTGRAGIEAARKRLRIGLRGHAESARMLGPGGAVSVRHAQLELDGGAAFADHGRLHGVGLVGAGFDLIAAEAKQHERGGVQRSFAPIVTAALRAGVRVHEDIDVFASAELVVALRRERFTSDDQPLAQTARTRTRLLLGVSWHVF